jgi:catechol 2,3-dioxygenase-like lactoylglutathione lyase family enzyme
MSERGHRARNVRFTLVLVCWTIAIVLFTLAVHHAVLNQWTESMADYYYVGRLIDHVHLRVADLEASRRFYGAVLGALGRRISYQDSKCFESDELFVDAAEGSISKVHLAFQADSEEMVRRFHEAGLAAGGRNNGAPGKRAFHPRYFGAFLLDPDGNNIEAVWHGPTVRSTGSIRIERTEN